MSPEERKAHLQSIGALPPDEDSFMEPSFGATAQPKQQAQEQPQSEDKSSPIDWGKTIAGAANAYANTFGVGGQSQSLDPRERLKSLVTPELLQKLRKRAGIGDGGTGQ